MKIIYFWKPLIWLGFIGYGLFTPAQDLPMKSFLKIPHFDKMVHFTLFFVLCLLMVRPLKRLNTRQYIWAPIISIFLGASLEIVQHTLSASRSTNVYDFLANTAGVLVAIIFYRFFVSGKKWEILY